MAQLGNYSYDIEAGSHRKKAMKSEQWAVLVLAQIKTRVIIKQLMRAQNVFFSLIMRGIHVETITTDPSDECHSEYRLIAFDISNLYLPILK